MPRLQRGTEWRGRRDADVCQHQKAIVSSVTLAISTITALLQLTPPYVTYTVYIHSRAAHHVAACHHCAVDSVGRLRSAGKGMLGHNLPGRRLASRMEK